MCPVFRRGLPLVWVVLVLPGVAQVSAQDSVYSHWPEVQQTAFNLACCDALFPRVEALLAKPVPPVSGQVLAGADGDTPGWKALADARRLLQQRDFHVASRRTEQALDAARSTGDRRLEMVTLGIIGSTAREVFLGSSLRAVPYHEEALAIAEELPDSAYIISQLLALADNYGQAGQNDLFLKYLGRAVPVLERFDQLDARMRTGNMFGCFLGMHQEPRRAEKIFRAVLRLAREGGDAGYVQHMYYQLFSLYLDLKDTDRANAALDSIQATGAKVPEENLYELRYQLEKLRGNRDQAFHYLEKAYQFLGTSYTNRSAEQLAGWEARLNTREKELQLEMQKQLLAEQQKVRWYLYGLMALVSLLLLVSLVAWYRQRQAKQALSRQHGLIEQQAAELKQLDRLKSRFFANVSHELRTPLTLVLGPLSEVLNDEQLSLNGRAMLQTAQRNGLQLLTLINEILDLSKLRATGPELQEQPTVLYDFLEETVSTFLPLAQNRKINLQLEYLPEKSLTLALDRRKLLKILNNLLSNALKFAPAESAVVLQAARRENSLLLQIRDAGPGIHPDDLPHIFDLYFQSKRPEAKPEGGTGIGLAFSLDLARAMGGRLWAESVSGVGGAFFLSIPAKERPMETAAPIAWGRRHTSELKPAMQPPALRAVLPPDEITARLLVVEDNPDLQAFLRMILPGDYQLTIADNGRAALDYLQESGQIPDLILSDVMMPELDGFQLVEALRNSDHWRAIPVVLLTALADRDDRLRAFRIGIDDYIVKPFSAEELLVRIENALRNLAARREWLENEPAEPVLAPEGANIWLENLQQLVRKNFANPQFNIDHLAEQLGIGRTTLYRQIRAKTGLSANQFIQELRLLHVRELLESGQYNTFRQVSDAVGFRSADYLSRLYRARFGKSPTAYL